MNSWSWDWAIRNLVAELMMPPVLWVALVLLGLLLLKSRPRLGRAMATIACVMILVTSTHAFYFTLLNATDSFMHWPKPYNLPAVAQKAGPSNNPKAAIVILGGGRTKGALEYPEYNHQDLSKETMMRVRMGARLARATGLPVLVSGGAPDRTRAQDVSEAVVMAQILEQEFGVKVRWQEGGSNTTEENAKQSYQLLQPAGVTQVYLVTQLWHMPRAQRIFQQQGLVVTPVPMGFEQADHLSPLEYFPSGRGLTEVRHLWHELLGAAWYKIRY
jgi:uncharacterized SAM-binding protein YcdF (DUF218 family)